MPSAPAHRYRPEIDGLRACAVASVMLYHLQNSWLPGGFVGVDVFFVISGYVVTGSLAQSRATSIWGFIGEFYARRLARILPALVVMLVVTALLATLFIPPSWLSEMNETTLRSAFFGLSNWTLMQNGEVYFTPRAELNPATHTWSLGVEEQYYLIAPLLIYLTLRGQRAGRMMLRHAAIVGLALLTLGSLAACIWASRDHARAAFYFVGFRFWELGLGALMFLVPPRISGAQPGLARFASWAGALCIGLAFWLAVPAAFPWPWALLPVAGTALIIRYPGDAVRRALSLPAAVWVGRRSYSLYLWHWPVYVLLRWTVGLQTPPMFAIALAASVALAALSYRWVEQPWRHNRGIERAPMVLRVAGFVMLPILGAGLVNEMFVHRASLTLSSVARSADEWYPGAGFAANVESGKNCHVSLSHSRVGRGNETRYLPTQCTGPAAARALFVLGDSHAMALGGMLEHYSAEHGTTVTLVALASCGMPDLQTPMAQSSEPGCARFTKAATARVLALAHPDDIVLLPSLRLARFGDQVFGEEPRDSFARMYNPAAMLLRRAASAEARRWLHQFVEHRLIVVFAAPTPIFKAPAYRCADWFDASNPVCAGHLGEPRAEMDALRGPVIADMQALAGDGSRIHIWDGFPTLCPGAVCHALRRGHPLMFDGDHISGYAASLLYPGFEAFMAALPGPGT